MAFQNVAKRLKEENDALRLENQLLREKISRMEEEIFSQTRDRRQQSLDIMSSAMAVSNKRVKLSVDASNTNTFANPQYITLTPSMTSPQEPKSLSDSDKGQGQGSTHISGYTDTVQSNEGASSFGSCGLCNEVIPCLCHAIVTQDSPGEAADFKDHTSTSVFSRPELQNSILDNLPPYQPAVPLPRKHGTLMNSIFPVVPLPSAQEKCTGDPSNCPACADDAFGKAFCTAICRSVGSQSPCVDCPSNLNQNKRNHVAKSDCHSGDPESRNTYSSVDHPNLSTGTSPKTIPTNEAWKKIKEHPNVSFADLNLLAEVVARRSKCTGPTVVISPAPGEATPERVASPEANAQTYSIQELFLSTTDTRNMEDRTSSQQSMVVGCGYKGVREVYTDGVRDALHLLDKTFS